MARSPAALSLLVFLVGCGSIEYGADEPSGMVITRSETYEETVVDDVAEVSISVFLRELAPYGDWVDSAEHGTVFVPQDPGYRPYRDGQWVLTEEGFAWVSQDAIGWAVEHYGSWTILSDGRWAWIPGTAWSPGDVEWRSNDEYVGWAPQIVGTVVPVASWVFVQTDYLFADYLPQAYLAGPAIPGVYASCAPRRWRGGPPARWRRQMRVRARRASARRVRTVQYGARRGHGMRGSRGVVRGVRRGSDRRQASGAAVGVRSGGARRRASGADVRVRSGDVRAARGPVRERRWVPRETVVLGGQPVPDRRGPGNSVVLPGPREPRRVSPQELHPVRPPVGDRPSVPRAERQPPRRFVGPRPRYRSAPGPTRTPPRAAALPRVQAPRPTPTPQVSPPPRRFPQRRFAVQPSPRMQAQPTPRAQPQFSPRAQPRPQVRQAAPRIQAAPRRQAVQSQPRVRQAPPRARVQPRRASPRARSAPRRAAPRRGSIQRSSGVRRGAVRGPRVRR